VKHNNKTEKGFGVTMVALAPRAPAVVNG